MTDQEAELLRALCSHHRSAIEGSRSVGCFHCEQSFEPGRITTWLDEPAQEVDRMGQTAICPICGVDAVLPESCAGTRIGPDTLQMLNRYWFGAAEA